MTTRYVSQEERTAPRRARLFAADLAAAFSEVGFGPFFGTPCGILAPLYSAIEQRHGLSTVAREDNAVGVAVGASLAGRSPVVLMQNSGLGQAVNALASLVVPYRIPMLLVVSVRGIPPDPTPENAVMGRLTIPVLATMGISHVTLDPTVAVRRQVERLSGVVHGEQNPAALLIPPASLGWCA
jgi:sulfopyruvate decarboxylase subunit alpha/phosphonopyruvate decarboxylase